MKKLMIGLSVVFAAICIQAAEFSTRELVLKARELIQLLQQNDGVLTRREEAKIFQHLDSAIEIALGGGSQYDSESEAKTIMLAGVEGVIEHESQTKIINKAIVYLNDEILLKLKRSCDPTSTWTDNKNCLIGGLKQIRSEVYIGERTTKNIILQMCVETKTWNSEANCFKSSIRASNNSNIEDSVVGCQSISNLESQAKCYRSSLTDKK